MADQIQQLPRMEESTILKVRNQIIQEALARGESREKIEAFLREWYD